jgi:hypothetical protein
MLKLFSLLIFVVFSGFTFSQGKVTFLFNNVEESIYNYNNESFEELGEMQGLGQIEIHYAEKAVVIDCNNDECDKELKIIEKNEENKEEEMYICAMNGQYYAFTVSSDRSKLTLVSADYRYVYNIKD